MICCSVAKMLSERLQPELYAQQMKLEGVPMLGEVLPPGVEGLRVKDIMTRSANNALRSVLFVLWVV